MRTRTITVASFLTVAMAATLMGALYTAQAFRPRAVRADALWPTPAPAPPSTPIPASGTASAFGLETFRDIARRVNPGVVNISTSKVVRQRFRNPLQDLGEGENLLERFFGPGPQGQSQERSRTLTSLGSGFVIDADGYILTNRHVIEDADKVEVTFPGGKKYDAKIVGRDARTDVGLLKIEASEPLTVLTLGDSEKLEVGEWVMAVGNPFNLGGNSVTVGVVSYRGERPQLQLQPGTNVEFIQTDAAINPGNSGGPLLNTRGEVVGINTMIVTGGAQASAGVGFAVAINVAREILPQLRQTGKVTRGWLGVTINSMTEDLAATYGLTEAAGAVVGSVTQGSPAERAGLQPEDVVLSVDGRRIQSNSDLSRYIASKAPGTTVKLTVLRGKDRKTYDVTLGTFPDEPGEQSAADESGQSKLGMTLRDLTPTLSDQLNLPRGSRGVVVMDVEAGEVAEEAGLQRGDLIVSVNGRTVDGVDAFGHAIEEARPSGRARLRLRRGDGYLVVVLRVK